MPRGGVNIFYVQKATNFKQLRFPILLTYFKLHLNTPIYMKNQFIWSFIFLLQIL